MRAMKPVLAAALLIGTITSCLPSASDNQLFDASSDQIKIDVVEQNKRMIFKAPPGKKITKINSIAIAKERIGKFTAGVNKRYVSMFSETDKPFYDIEITVDGHRSCRTATNGVSLTNGGSFLVGCVSQEALVTQLKTACKELADTQEKFAIFDASKDSCECLKRVNKTLKYSDYLGRVTSFKLECKNSGTADQLRTFCSEIKDRQCQTTTIIKSTCMVGQETCTCPKNVTLSYDKFLTNVEEFKNQCGNQPTINELKPVDPSLHQVQVTKLFADECRKFSGELIVESEDNRRCKCTNGLIVEISNWKTDTRVLNNMTCEDLVPESDKSTVTKPEGTKPQGIQSSH